MISFFPDVNVWLALSIADHSHSEDAWRWLGSLASDASLAFGRHTIGNVATIDQRSSHGSEAADPRKGLGRMRSLA